MVCLGEHVVRGVGVEDQFLIWVSSFKDRNNCIGGSFNRLSMRSRSAKLAVTNNDLFEEIRMNIHMIWAARS